MRYPRRQRKRLRWRRVRQYRLAGLHWLARLHRHLDREGLRKADVASGYVTLDYLHGRTPERDVKRVVQAQHRVLQIVVVLQGRDA